jgi:uncharacterized protein YjiS (DUF1127 family)
MARETLRNSIGETSMMTRSATALSNANPFGRLLGAIGWLIERRNLKATQRHLESLDDYMLKDIGISRCDIPAIMRVASQARRTPANSANRRIPNLPPQF